MKKKIFSLFLGGILIMTLLTGCAKSEKDILGEFTSFIHMFPSEDLTYLYDKQGDTRNLKNDDLGTWTVDTYVKYKEGGKRKSCGVVIFFNRNLKEARGKFVIKSTEETLKIEKEEYPIYYDKEGIHFLEEIKDKEVLNKFNKFKMLFDYVSIDEEYLSNLELEQKYYNPNVPMYGLTYKLPKGDENIKKIKEMYPELEVKEDEAKLEFEGECDPESTVGIQSLEILLDEKEKSYLSASYNFNKSESSIELFNEEK